MKKSGNLFNDPRILKLSVDRPIFLGFPCSQRIYEKLQLR